MKRLVADQSIQNKVTLLLRAQYTFTRSYDNLLYGDVRKNTTVSENVMFLFIILVNVFTRTRILYIVMTIATCQDVVCRQETAAVTKGAAARVRTF